MYKKYKLITVVALCATIVTIAVLSHFVNKDGSSLAHNGKGQSVGSY